MWELLYKNVNGKDTKKKPSDASIIFFVEEYKGRNKSKQQLKLLKLDRKIYAIKWLRKQIGAENRHG
jgi:hypothetical protein